MGNLLGISVIIAGLLAGSIILIAIKRFRKIGLSVLGTFLLILLISGIYMYVPRNYERKYLKNLPEWKELTFRKYADSLCFYIGAIPGKTQVSDPLFYNNFNSVTPENALKMGPLLDNFQIGVYDFSNADKLINKALEKKLRVRGHTLVWGKQSDMFKSPDLRTWLKNYPEQERSNILRQAIENHITTVLNHFKGRIHVWDVVNEPMSIFRSGKLEDNVYYKYLGENYIARSFELAHSIDPSLKLYLNENFISYTDKQARGFIELIKRLKSSNIPIHGIGIQSHIVSKQDTSIADLQNFIKTINDMGLEVEITELDIRLRLFNAAKDPYEAQGRYYTRLLGICMANPLCKGVTFWGFSDDRCWMDNMFIPKPNEPYLFDAELNPKPVFYEIYKSLKREFENRHYK